jgi:hypothetical protein
MVNDDDDDDDGSSPRRKHETGGETTQQRQLIVKIVSASFGPCEGRRALNGRASVDETSSIPHTRDVAPSGLLIAQAIQGG